ncbi:MAG: hypothetical protein EZS28_030512 [Streblomastix strix]|uniref:Uncharacterized protein n=1 Tax=Streblomastix strix TaxID=222440 RepID=A0A5J4UV58_9EUKA|nr:MAG: hypothetical protein EZS28_030512 [Streblomastix strix]
MRRFRLTYQSVSGLNFQSGQSLLFHSTLYPSSEATNKNTWGGQILSTSGLLKVCYFREEQTAFIDLLDKTVGTNFIELTDTFSFKISLLDYNDDDDDEYQYCVYYYRFDDLSTITDILNSGAEKSNLFRIPVASDTTIG